MIASILAHYSHSETEVSKELSGLEGRFQEQLIRVPRVPSFRVVKRN
jgi:hypothetical protein